MTNRIPILTPGRNCWSIDHAARVAFLIDGDAYFRAFRAAVAQARHSVLILGWDFDTRLVMVRDGPIDAYPVRLGDFLRAVLARRRELHVYVLNWDFHMIYSFEREWLSRYKLSWQRRFHFKMDNDHPVAASHHQKVVVVDDLVAFAGGFDLAQCRWDTPEHLPDDPRRTAFDDPACPPFHDVQMLVSGAAAGSLGKLARERWARATNESIPAPTASLNDPWPAHVKPDIDDVPVAIARTEPQHAGRPEVREVEGLFIDAIRAAHRFLYIETQYLTCNRIADALAARLETAEGPEVVLVLHPNSGGWLEQYTMDVLREQVLEVLHAADRHGRLMVYYPHVPGLGERCMTVHSKVLIVDDEFVRVGSANLSNRSMGFDTECDLAIEAGGEHRTRQAITAVRNRLLGEHLGVTPETVAERFRNAPSAIAAVESLRGDQRTLKPFTRDLSPGVDSWLPDSDLIDPDRPLDPDVVVDRFVPPQQRQPAGRRILTGAVILLGLLGIAAAWQWTPLRAWLDIDRLVGVVTAFQDSDAAPFIVIGGFIVGGLVVFPVTVLIAVTVLAFGPLLGFTYSLIGMTLSAVATYGIGRALGRHAVHRLAGSRLNRLSRRLAKRGLLTVIAVRVLPVAPFTIVNMVAGASHIGFRDFLLGTIIGELPGLVAMSAFFDHVWAAIRHPGPKTFLVLVALAAAIVAGAWALRRWLSRQDRHSLSVNRNR
ncbi:MAG: VTT domain-containing protein [Nitrospiraceae bacterium]